LDNSTGTEWFVGIYLSCGSAFRSPEYHNLLEVITKLRVQGRLCSYKQKYKTVYLLKYVSLFASQSRKMLCTLASSRSHFVDCVSVPAESGVFKLGSVLHLPGCSVLLWRHL